MKTIKPGELEKKLRKNPELILWDVRTPVEYSEVHVPEARSTPLDRLFSKILLEQEEKLKEKEIFLICRSDSRSRNAAETLAKRGFDNVVVVEGGTLAWIKEGLPVERGSVKVLSLERQVRIAAGSLVLLGAALGWRVHPAFYGLSAFIGAGLVFAGITDWCGLGLLIAKLPWNTRADSQPSSSPKGRPLGSGA